MGVGEKHSRMRWLWGLCVALAVFTAVTAKPAGLGDSDQTELELESEFISELLTNLLVPAERQAREIADEQDEEEVVEITEVETAEGEAMEDSEALKEAKKVEVSRFNNYIDAIYRRMNAALKAKLMDPMELNLDEKPKKNDVKKGKLEKTRVLREALDEEDTEIDEDSLGEAAKAEEEDGEARGMKGRKKERSKEERLAEKNDRRARKKKKSDAKDKKKAMKEKKMKAREKKKEMKKKMEMKAKKSKDTKEKKMEAKRKRKNKDVRESRSNRKNKNKKKGQNKNKNKPTNKRKNNNKRGKDSMRNNEKKARKGNDGKDEKMVGSLSGIATMIREGDVAVVDEETHKVVTSEFRVGPLQLQVSKIYGRGKARTVKTAKAITDVMSGTLVLKVKPDGTAHVKKVVFKKPENVEVKGKLSENDPRSLNYLRNSVNKMRPLAAMKVLKTARYVLKSPNAN